METDLLPTDDLLKQMKQVEREQPSHQEKRVIVLRASWDYDHFVARKHQRFGSAVGDIAEYVLAADRDMWSQIKLQACDTES